MDGTFRHGTDACVCSQEASPAGGAGCNSTANVEGGRSCSWQEEQQARGAQGSRNAGELESFGRITADVSIVMLCRPGRALWLLHHLCWAAALRDLLNVFVASEWSGDHVFRLGSLQEVSTKGCLQGLSADQEAMERSSRQVNC